MKDGRIVVMAREAGAAAALAPVARALMEVGLAGVSIVASDEAAAVFDRRGLPLLAFPERPSRERVERLLERERAVALVTGTSVYPDRDNVFWEVARARSVPSLALIDHWCNYVERFSHRRPFDCVPDVVAVIDEDSKAELARAGCPAAVEVTGHPYFDDLVHAHVAEARARARRELGIAPDLGVVVFASQPESTHFGTSLNHVPHDRYTEHEVAELVRSAIAAVAPDALLVVKLHPLEDAHSFDDMTEAETPPDVRVLRAYPSPSLIAAADVVCGMTSMFLLESALMGIPTISIRPGGDENHFAWRHAGLIQSVLEPDAVVGALERALAGEQATSEQVAAAAFRERAIERTTELVYRLAETRQGAAR